jgi:hypothetical protein
MLNRRLFVAGVLVSLASGATAAGPAVVEVYKTPTCGCCSAWVHHLRSHGFEVRVTNLEDVTPLATKLGVPASLRSCHTARVAGYFVEGHVPAADIRKLLKEMPNAAGIAVPGMPAGSPGMDQGSRTDPYETLLVDRRGGTRLFVAHPAKQD